MLKENPVWKPIFRTINYFKNTSDVGYKLFMLVAFVVYIYIVIDYV